MNPPSQIKYKGTIYKLRSAGDVQVSPGSPVGPEGVLLIERQYPTESRALYIDNDGDFFAKIKLNWHKSNVFDELTFDLSPAGAKEFFDSLKTESDGKLSAKIPDEQVRQLWGPAVPKTPEGVDPKKVIDVSGHYIKVSDLPADIKREAAYTFEGLLREELASISKIEGRFCSDPFSVMGLRYNVPEHVVQLFAETLTNAMNEYLREQFNTQATVDINVADSCGPVDGHGGIYVFGNGREELNNLRVHLEGNVLLPVWREVWNRYQQGEIPVGEKQRALASFKVKVLAAVRPENGQ